MSSINNSLSSKKCFENKIINWLKNKIKSTKKKGLILGLSGGIDSAVVSLLSKKAVGKKNSLCVIMPCEGQKEEIKTALKFAKKFNLKTKLIDITGIYKQFLKVLPDSDKITRGNLKARIRMCILYYLANKYNYIVTGTGNKTEIYLGYFTKYGDGGVDILPVGGLLKRDIVAMARYLGVPDEILNKPPSAGFYKGQTDEEELGMTYQELDDIVEKLTEKKKIKVDYKKEKKVKILHKKSEHKRNIPDILKI